MKNASLSGQPGRRKLAVVLASFMALTTLTSPGAAMADAGGTGGSVRGADGSWAVMAGSSLKSTLEGWSAAAGWTLIWDNPIDYQLRASVSFSGSYEEAVGRLIDSIYQGNPEVNVTLYRGNKVLHVQQQSLTSN